LSPSNLEILAYHDTPLGPLCLRRRELLSAPGSVVTEITLDHRLLMSSRQTAAEEALARVALEMRGGSSLSVLVGGLGLGYTAHAALASAQVTRVQVIELLPQVIEWLEQDLIPLSSVLTADERFHVVQGDAFAYLAGPASEPFDVILIDIDHAPEDRLSPIDHGFYSEDGLRRALRHLTPGGVIGVWSYAVSSPFSRALRRVFVDVRMEPIAFFSDLAGEQRTDWLFFAS
jgi:spermidine synthase